VRLPQENTLRISTIRDTVTCPICQLSQFERGNGKCRRCNHSLGISYFELRFSYPFVSRTSQTTATPIEVGTLIRRLRSRCGITQSALASLTGIHRTYLSRAESGQVTPSISSLMRIFRALGVDKILLRVRGASHTS